MKQTMLNFTLLAIPYFIFLGTILEKSGLAENLLRTVGTLLAATTGVVAATNRVMGVLTLPVILLLVAIGRILRRRRQIQFA